MSRLWHKYLIQLLFHYCKLAAGLTPHHRRVSLYPNLSIFHLRLLNFFVKWLFFFPQFFSAALFSSAAACVVLTCYFSKPLCARTELYWELGSSPESPAVYHSVTIWQPTAGKKKKIRVKWQNLWMGFDIFKIYRLFINCEVHFCLSVNSSLVSVAEKCGLDLRGTSCMWRVLAVNYYIYTV